MSCGCGCKEEAVAEEFEVCEACASESECASQGYCAKSKEAGYKEDKKASECECEDECQCVSASECGIGEELIDGECRKVAVNLDIEIAEATTRVEASTGETIIEISGIAFHSGMNKNKWSLTPEGARHVASQMVGADLTLNHPDASDSGVGFGRNTEGGVDKANVGVITSATYLPTIGGGYEVRYIAHVTRHELFEPLESGLWLKPEYGVSIGGSGIPVSADEDGITFGEDFTFDHLAIVHRPAYPRANIETVERIKKEEVIEATFISHSNSDTEQQEVVIAMTDEIIENTEIDYEAQIESLKADLVLASSRVAEFEAAEEARAEEARASLVEKATEMGMSGHEDLQTETLETLIASWEASHPEPEVVEMKPVDETPTETAVASEEEAPRSVVANYLNGELVESDEDLYARCWNAWAKAYNGTLSADEKSEAAAPMYEAIKEMI